MKTLRRKFILFAMSAVTVLLVLLVSAINGISVYITNRQEKLIMDTLVNAEGNFNLMVFRDTRPAKRSLLPPLNMDQMRSTRFFVVKFDESGNAFEIILDEIFSVSPEQANEFGKAIYEKGTSSGKIDRFLYRVKQIGVNKEIYFADISRQNDNLRMILFASTAISLLSWIFVLIFAVLISGKVVQPILEGYEKQKRFITDAGHELKTPLAIIQTNNDAMTLIHGENKYNRNIKAQAIRLAKLTADLLVLAKYDEEIVLQKEEINLSELSAEIIPAYKDSAEAHGINFSSVVEPDIMFKSNREALTRLITILLDNAVKYTPENGDIIFAIRKNGNHVAITEENICEPPENKNTEQLFERFYRGDSARTQQGTESGYGIGLSMGRMIAEDLGGSLKAEYVADDRIRFTAVF